MENFGINGLTYAGTGVAEPPILLVIGPEKCGKSTLSLSLFDWPNQGDRPLVLAFDALGFDSVAQFGSCPGIKVKDQPGLSFWDKTTSALTTLENAFVHSRRATPFTSIVVDCASTMADKFLQEARAKGNKNQLQDFGEALKHSMEVLWRLIDLGKPLIFLAWLREGFSETSGSQGQKKTVTKMGGALIEGQFKTRLAGRATQILYLEKVKQGANAPGADREGYVRIFHTRPYNNVDAGGRLSQFLPDPCQAHLGYVLTQLITGRQQQQLAAQQAQAAQIAAQQLSPNGGQSQPLIQIQLAQVQPQGGQQ